ncbi:hypothetical protein ACFQS7_22830 [Dankookia sp. GCM10030260]|uniref:hypothetical protein n=1 Tax=Dankookia sp. GCM10030260 TaxID=3273390 RepID=UPI00360BA7A1
MIELASPLVAPWAEAWLPAFLLAAGLTAGALVALALGHLLGEAWLAPLHPPLAAMARAAPVLLPLALPLLLVPPAFYPWAAAPGASAWYRADAFLLRGLAVLLLWVGLGRLLARPYVRGRTAGAALLLLVLTGALAMEDWALSRDQAWTGSLQGLALLVEQAGAAIALATLLALRHVTPDDDARTGLERALLTFAMATLWLWFVQYVVVYAANLPQEAAWYLRRSGGPWGWVKAGIAVPALLAAIGLALVPQWRRWRLAAVSALLLVQHLAHLAWVVRPDATLAGNATPVLADALVPGAMALAVALAWRRTARAG